MINLITLAGKGNRFSKEGYDTPKPLIKVNGDYMIHEAVKCLPTADKYVFVCLKEHIDKYEIDNVLLSKYKNSEIVVIDEVTEGQACTAELGINGSNIDLNEPLLISSCDYGLEWSEQKYKSIDADVIVWTTIHNNAFSNNPIITPTSFDADMSELALNGAIICDMDANDTALVKIAMESGAAQTDIKANGVRTNFGGYLLG
mgnify:CR=1 FL=1